MLFLTRLQPHPAIITDPHHHHTTRQTFAGRVLFLRERDADFGHGTGRRAGGIVDEGLLFVVDEDAVGAAAVAAVGGGGDGQAAVVGFSGGVGVGGRGVVEGEALFAELAFAVEAEGEEVDDEAESDHAGDEEGD